MKKLVLATSAMLTACGAFALTPTWTIPDAQRGLSLEKARIGIPESAVANPNTFAVEVTFEFTEDIKNWATLPIFTHESGPQGYAMWFNRYSCGGPGHGGLFLRCNGVEWELGRADNKPGEKVTYALAAKRGGLTVYVNGRAIRRFVMTPVPMIEPVQVGASDTSKNLAAGVKIVDAKAYGDAEEYVGKGEDMNPPQGFSGGKGWLVSVPADESKPLPRLLYIGDSISMGYDRPLQNLLKGKGYGYHWVHFDGCPDTPQKKAYNVKREPYLGACSFKKYDVIVYNNGLHSQGWQEGYTDEKSILDHYRSAIDVMREAAPQAKIVFLSSTPLCAKGADGKMHLEETPGRNGCVRYLNRLAEQVMKEKGVEYFDIYTELEKRMDLMSPDGAHWQMAGSELIARRVFDKFMSLAP